MRDDHRSIRRPVVISRSMVRDFHPLDAPSPRRRHSPRRRLPAGVRIVLVALYLSVIACVMAVVHKFLARP